MSHASIHVRVPFSDVDSSQRIHFTAMLRYMEIAEHELVRSLGFPRTAHYLDMSFPRVHVACDYLGAIGFDDELTIEPHVAHVGNTSWTITFVAHLVVQAGKIVPDGGKIVARGQMIMVALDLATERATPLPDELRAALSAYEQQE